MAKTSQPFMITGVEIRNYGVERAWLAAHVRVGRGYGKCARHDVELGFRPLRDWVSPWM